MHAYAFGRAAWGLTSLMPNPHLSACSHPNRTAHVLASCNVPVPPRTQPHGRQAPKMGRVLLVALVATASAAFATATAATARRSQVKGVGTSGAADLADLDFATTLEAFVDGKASLRSPGGGGDLPGGEATAGAARGRRQSTLISRMHRAEIDSVDYSKHGYVMASHAGGTLLTIRGHGFARNGVEGRTSAYLCRNHPHAYDKRTIAVTSCSGTVQWPKYSCVQPLPCDVILYHSTDTMLVCKTRASPPSITYDDYQSSMYELRVRQEPTFNTGEVPAWAKSNCPAVYYRPAATPHVDHHSFTLRGKEPVEFDLTGIDKRLANHGSVAVAVSNKVRACHSPVAHARACKWMPPARSSPPPPTPSSGGGPR